MTKAKHIVIVESPAKAKTIGKFLGDQYLVRASMGHVRDLPEKRLGIDLDHGFTPEYMIIPQRTALIKELSNACHDAERVYLATDLDREGEAIAWHLAEALQIPQDRVCRIIFNEITKNAIENAFRHPQTISMDKVNAQQARRLLDRIVGYHLSPLLWKKIMRGLSAGRVQSVAVRLIVEREKEIAAFQSEEYWKITALLTPQADITPFAAEIKKVDEQKIELKREEQAQQLVEELTGQPFRVAEIVRKEKEDKAMPPFTTSLLQQQASIQLRFSTGHTMRVAQQLYEGVDVGQGPVGLISYMRTDSFHVSAEALEECRAYITAQYGSSYLPAKPNFYRDKKEAQAAHEAIRPTSVRRTPQMVQGYLSPDQFRLYKLIWDRFVASQMTPARYAITTVSIRAGRCLFEAKGKEQLFNGFTLVYTTEARGEKEPPLPSLHEGQLLQLQELKPSQHFTQPPPRYTEATLVKTLESKGIGRPSTYAPIIATITKERGYVLLQDRKFFATELGIKVNDRLVQHFSRIMAPEFTSQMEDELDQIEEGKLFWDRVLNDFYHLFRQDLDKAYSEMESLKERPEVSAYTCEKCNAPMVYKYNKQGKFLGCSAYPKCKHTLSLTAEGKPYIIQTTEIVCPRCNSPMLRRLGRLGEFLGCANFPECKNTMALGPDGSVIAPEKTELACELCGQPMIIKPGKNGKFLACSRYPECRNTRSLEPNKKSLPSIAVQETCPKCGRAMAVRKSRLGLFLGCTGYPKCRQLKPLPLAMNLPEDTPKPVCEKCGKPMAIKKGRRGLFWGCSGYPECKQTKPLELPQPAAAKDQETQ